VPVASAKQRKKLQCPCSKKGQGPYDKLQTNSKFKITNHKEKYALRAIYGFAGVLSEKCVVENLPGT
jgi:hypothetical protein